MPNTSPAEPQNKARDPDTAVSLGRLGGFIGFRLRRIQNHLSHEFHHHTRDLTLRSGTLSALGVIEANPGISQSDVARQIGQDASTAAQLIDDLEKKGWIVRERLRENRRRYAIRITDSGVALLDELLAKLALVEDALLNSLSSQDLLHLSRVLDKIYADCF